jgi:pimeloyl-ACP methyl ester carboxylesterase
MVHRRRGRRLVAAGTTVAVLLLAGCGASTRSATPTSQAATTTKAPQSQADFSGLVDIGGNRAMYMECHGSGTPTVVLISGAGGSANDWSRSLDPAKPGPTVFSDVAKSTRVCAYDRPGTITPTETYFEKSRSTPVPQPTFPSDGVSDLHAMLATAHEQGPFVLVAHSFGGLIARLYASTYPGDVAGLVLIDALSEEYLNGLTPQQWNINMRLNETVSKDVLAEYPDYEQSDWLTSFGQLRAAPPIRAIPVIVLSADKPFDFEAMKAQGVLPSDTPSDFGDAQGRAQARSQGFLASIVPDAKHVTKTNSGHYIQIEQPQLVIDSILEVVDRVRRSRP